MIKTVLFDLDGTLINTNDLIIASFLHTLDQYYPQKYTEKDIVEFIGEPLEVSFGRMESDEAKIGEMVGVYRKHNVAMHDALVKEYPNVLTTIETLHSQGYKLGVVTTKRLDTVALGLKLSKLEPYFDVVVTIDDVVHAKPDPEPVLKALKALNAQPSEALMVGDSPSDIEAGKKAGTKTVAVGWSIKGADLLRQSQPDYLIDDMKEMLEIVQTV
ncbi:pyrophosphatase PpaX [Pullulanibacillus pueri]|uniref:Pyrophosphatase PpaX n=1 Tax=Pullulanibacillus pueri TaxID=1437324 RepID=A0A8J3A0R0_9BACL|nr:pyrophosphatase PpaX [Pullulanibacillus pueri]MBM7680223.1 pyrophosphatase PpaX [Pullulanibacillus pueri]GGH89042.1 pyrophosphatase PpaX [Pullulanibacillus pueri]